MAKEELLELDGIVDEVLPRQPLPRDAGQRRGRGRVRIGPHAQKPHPDSRGRPRDAGIVGV